VNSELTAFVEFLIRNTVSGVYGQNLWTIPQVDGYTGIKDTQDRRE